MRHCWFEVVTDGSDLEGEEFLVGANTKEEAMDIAAENFEGEELKYHGTVSNYQAECMGLDEY